MRLQTLTVGNYRGIPDQTFELVNPITVFAGENGRGKSSLLHLISRMLGHFLPQVSPAPKSTSRFSILDVRNPEANMGARLEMTVPAAGRIAYRCGAELAGGNRGSSSFEKLSLPLAEAIRQGYGNPATEEDASPLAVLYSTERSAYRFPNRRLKATQASRVRAFDAALSSRPVSFARIAANLEADILLEGEIRQANPAFLGPTAIEAIEGVLSNFVDGFQYLRVRDNPYCLVINKGDTELRLNQLSDGERSLLAMVVDLARRLIIANPLLPDPVRNGSAVVLIDELELHLHPKWQQEIVAKLTSTFRGCQFITTTHSPFIVQSLEEGQLFNLDGPVQNVYADQGIEEAARYGLRVESPETSQRYDKLYELAEQYFTLVGEENERFDELNEEEKARATELERQMEELTSQFTRDPVYSAFLHVKLQKGEGG